MLPPRPFPRYPVRPRKYGGGARIVVNHVEYYLGKHGSPESIAEYQRLQIEHAAGKLLGRPAKPKSPPNPDGPLVSDLIAAWYKQEIRGPMHGEVIRTVRACVPLERLHGRLPSKQFAAEHLEEIQLAMLTCSWMTPEELERCGTWSRGYINAQIDRLRRVFRWGETKGFTEKGTWQHLKSLAPIRRNDRRARNTAARLPCDWENQVKPAMARMYPVVQAMVQTQFYGGMRPGEVVVMRRCEIKMNGPEGTWLYSPIEHKTAYSGHQLVKVLGPQAQEVLRPWLLKAEQDGFVFPPVRDRFRRGRYRVEGYHRAIVEACKIARVPHFTPYQIRHLSKQLATRAFDLDHARAFLGQTSLGATNEYARQIDLRTAAEVAKKIG